ncbi:MAG TPA: hypothetical protein VJ978_15760 [Nitriliruptoraceae bacterium]|nr:hypothetical protein [Nitriliruptoraceae bacterium]
MPRPRTPSTSTIGVAGLVALGAAAAVRRANEARLERSGTLARLGPATEPELPGSRLDRRIATWEPPRPRGARARAATAAWAAPATVAGLLLAVLGRGDVAWNGDIGAWVATGVGGPSGMVLRRAGMTANTAGQVVLCTVPTPSRVLLEHEAVHVRQFERLGVAVYPLYLWFSARHGYRTNPFEVGARRGAARRMLSRTRPATTPGR